MECVPNGFLIDSRVRRRRFARIEKGPLQQVHALIVHQTGAPTAQSTFDSYDRDGNGAHFLIDRNGTIYQTALVTKKTHHVGRIRSRCLELHVCTPADQKKIESILSQAGKSYGQRVLELHRHEAKKKYPARYPKNDDSLGIEIVGRFDDETETFDPVTARQNLSLRWLVRRLSQCFGLQVSDIYRHPLISYKQPSEAATAQW